MPRATIVIAAVLALAAMLPAMPAQAAAPRTFVSAAGSDSNNCTNVATPCRHLTAAYAATLPNGEIYVLDPANYGSLTITGPVSIEGHGWASIAPVSGNPAITINAGGSDKINIIGVVLDGTALTGTDGIRFNSGGSLNVRDSVIRNFSGTGIYFVPNVNSNLFVSNTLVADNGDNGISVFPNGAVSVTATFSRVEANNNANNGIGINGSRINGGNGINAVVYESVAAGNGGDGFIATGPTFSVNLDLYHCIAANNFTGGIEANSGNSFIGIEQSTVSAPFPSKNWIVSGTSGPGTIYSYGDNYFDPGSLHTGTLTPETKQ